MHNLWAISIRGNQLTNCDLNTEWSEMNNFSTIFLCTWQYEYLQTKQFLHILFKCHTVTIISNKNNNVNQTSKCQLQNKQSIPTLYYQLHTCNFSNAFLRLLHTKKNIFKISSLLMAPLQVKRNNSEKQHLTYTRHTYWNLHKHVIP